MAAAQQRCARQLGADGVWFGVNGATGLLQAGLLALAPPGSRVLLPRNLHRSLLHACVLGQLRPLLFNLPFDPATGLWLPPSPTHLAQVLDAAAVAGPVAALVLVSPSYQGQRADLPALVALAQQRGLPVLVDQAHGRAEALSAGADLVVLSSQKAAGGLAQSAALLLQGQGVDRIIEVDIAANAHIDLAALRRGGEVLVYGSGKPGVELPFFPLIVNNVSLSFFIVYNLSGAERAGAQATLTGWLARGALIHNIAHRLPLAQIVQAHQAVELASAPGNVVIEIP